MPIPQKILLLKYRSLGDSVLGISSVSYLGDVFPESKITYGVPSRIFPLYASRQDFHEKDGFFPLSFETARDWWKTLLNLRKRKFDAIVELHQSGRSGTFFKLYSFFSNTPYFYHNHNEKKGLFIVDQGVPKANIQRDLDGIYSIASKRYGKSLPLPSYLDYPPRLFYRQNDLKNPFVILLGVSAGRGEKEWPLEYFAGLCRLLLEKSDRYRFLIAFSPLEKEMQEKWMSFSTPYVCAKTVSLNGLPHFMAKASYYVGNDSGIKHLAAAMGMKTCTFFGSRMEHPREWHPYDTKQHLFFHPQKGLKGNISSEDYELDKNFFTQLTPERVVLSMESHSFFENSQS